MLNSSKYSYCRLGRRETSLLSLYGGIVSTILCSVVGNYLTLLLSRVLIGFTVGLHLSVCFVLLAEQASSKKVLDILLLVGCLGYSLGSIWVPVLGYCILDLLGWRTFLLIASLPLMIPPILILHLSITSTSKLELSNQAEQSENEETEVLEVPNFKMRLFKVCLFTSINTYNGWGTILLLPALIRRFNIKKDEGGGSNCESMTQGTEFLLLAFVFGAAALGRIACPFIRKKIRFRILYSLIAVLILICYMMLLLIQEDLVVIVVMSFVGKFGNGMMSMEKTYMSYDVQYFGTKGLAIGAGIIKGASLMSVVAGTTLVSFASPQIAIIFGLVLSIVQIIVVNSMGERDQESEPETLDTPSESSKDLIFSKTKRNHCICNKENYEEKNQDVDQVNNQRP